MSSSSDEGAEDADDAQRALNALNAQIARDNHMLDDGPAPFFGWSFINTNGGATGALVARMMATNLETGVETLVDVYSLPHMLTRPSFDEIVAAIEKIDVKPPSWGSRVANQPVSERDHRACAKYLSSIISNDLPWIPYEWQRDQIVKIASKCLSMRCGRTPLGDITRTWKLWSDLPLRIHEPALTGDNLGLKTWASSYLLAKRLEIIMTDHPLQVPNTSGYPFEVLELGSGTGLVGLAAAAIWGCSVILSDLPEITTNLERNVVLNEDMISTFGGYAEARPLDWNHLHDGDNSEIEHFQFILAADPLYSPEHAPMLAKVIDKNLQRDPDARVIIELPYRDEATRTMANNLRSILDGRNFELLEHGEEYGYDDWEEGGDNLARIHCWWGIWCRRMPVNSVDKSEAADEDESAPIVFI